MGEQISILYKKTENDFTLAIRGNNKGVVETEESETTAKIKLLLDEILSLI